ncbi:TPA: hypothetical protein SMO99_003814 [Proteus mirabilis]|uniref:Uncharacterized protein n=1 Tax=Morganella morganii TaxID=582 RepID=A0AAI9HUF9_MORMO|nr:MULTISPECIES: hypothetical protein [unclassified Providencia]EJV1665003.1 hypothetical protein [Klebsiella pneumoniae]EKW8762820.1 hypothetical protein [Morganella morganii]THB23094.1 hypothetical protein E6R27_18325 [Providencia sp. MGF014]TNU97596.1 hypothetical protein FH869_20870 [Providencia rettgeri]HEJ9425876.1 hypothetical protein [Proteus mirabilis]
MITLFTIVASTPGGALLFIVLGIPCSAIVWLTVDGIKAKIAKIALCSFAGFLLLFEVTNVAMKTQQSVAVSIVKRVPLPAFPIADSEASHLKSEYLQAIATASLFGEAMPTRRMMDVQSRAEVLVQEQNEKLIRVINGKG